MKIHFLGTGTSMGVPIIGCTCAVCCSDDPRDRRQRASVWIETGGRHLVIDTGTDFRRQALESRLPTLDAVLFTHHHVDHIFGLDDVRPINFIQNKTVRIFANDHTLEHLRRVYAYAFNPAHPQADIPRLQGETIDSHLFEFENITIQPLALEHGCLSILGYRIGNFAYCTDVSRIPEQTYSALQNLEVLVLGALRDQPHPTHFTIDQAVEEAQKIGARRTYLVHMSHEVSHRELLKRLPLGIFPAYDGLVLEIAEPVPGLNGESE